MTTTPSNSTPFADLLSQKERPYPERQYLLSEIHYRPPGPIPQLSLVTHVTFVQESYQDVYYRDLQLRLVDAMKNPHSSLFTILKTSFPRDLPPRVIAWLASEHVTHALMFGTINILRAELESRTEEGKWRNGARVDEEDRRALTHILGVLKNNEDIYSIDRCIRLISQRVVREIEAEPPETKPDTFRASLDTPLFDTDASIATVQPTDIFARDPDSVRRDAYRVYQMDPRFVTPAPGDASRAHRPAISFVWSKHAQHWNYTWFMSFPDHDPQALRLWQERLLDAEHRPLEDRLCVLSHLADYPGDGQFPGRRLSGSNYVFLPFDVFLRHCLSRVMPMADAPAGDATGARSRAQLIALQNFLSVFLEEIRASAVAHSMPLSAPLKAAEGGSPDGPPPSPMTLMSTVLAGITSRADRRQLEILLRHGCAAERVLAALDELVAQFAKPVLAYLFTSRTASDGGDAGPDLVVSRIGSSRAYFISDLVPRGAAMLVTGVIVDVGMSRHQRGRLVQRLGDLSTFRTLVLRDIGRVRATLEGLSFLGLQLSLSEASEIPEMSRTAEERKGDYASVLLPLRAKQKQIELLQSRLHRYNLLVTYGITNKGVSAGVYRQLLAARLVALHEAKVGPHQTLAEFMNRRLLGAEGNIDRAQHRYAELGAAIREHLDAISTFVSFAEADRASNARADQAQLLRYADFMIVLAGVYYTGGILHRIFGHWWHEWVWQVLGIPIALGIRFLAEPVVDFVRRTTGRSADSRAGDDGEFIPR